MVSLLPKSATSTAKRLLLAKAARSIGDGYVSILLPAYLLELGLSPVRVGVLATATLLGSATLTLFTGFITTRWDHRRPLLATSGLTLLTGVAFTTVHDFWPLLLIAFIGTLNPSSGDVSIFMPLEQSLLSHAVADRDRTMLFALYSLAGALFAAIGTLFAVVPGLADRGFHTTPFQAMQGMFLLYGLLGLFAGVIYRHLRDPHTERTAFPGATAWPVTAHRLSAGNAFQRRCVRRRLHRSVDSGVVAIQEVRAVRREHGQHFLLDEPAYSALVSGSGRPAAAGITSVPRSLAAAISPTMAGYFLSVSSFAWPLLICGVLKIAYDLIRCATTLRAPCHAPKLEIFEGCRH